VHAEFYREWERYQVMNHPSTPLWYG
jgi:hypothetical protein